MIPTINTTGIFNLAAPYNALTDTTQQFKVVSVRSLSELEASGEDPMNTVYAVAGEPESVFLDDLSNGVPVVALQTTGGEYFYIPANKLVSDATLTGIPYVEKSVIINLGHLPVSENIDTLVQILTDAAYDNIGVVPDVIVTDTSGVVNTDVVKHDSLLAARSAKKTVDKSYQTRYAELLELYSAQQLLITNIEDVYKATGVPV